MIQSLKTVLPIKQKENARVKKRVRLLLNEEDGRKKLEYYLEKNQRARARLMAALLDDQVLDYELVSRKLNITLAVVRALEEQGVLTLETEQVYRKSDIQFQMCIRASRRHLPHWDASGLLQHAPRLKNYG